MSSKGQLRAGCWVLLKSGDLAAVIPDLLEGASLIFCPNLPLAHAVSLETVCGMCVKCVYVYERERELNPMAFASVSLKTSKASETTASLCMPGPYFWSCPF